MTTETQQCKPQRTFRETSRTRKKKNTKKICFCSTLGKWENQKIWIKSFKKNPHSRRWYVEPLLKVNDLLSVVSDVKWTTTSFN